MKEFKTHLKSIAVFLSILLLLQGCVIYKKKPVTIDEAVKANTKVRIKTNDNQTLKFKKVEVENGIYYGLMNFKNKRIKTIISKEKVDKIQLQNEEGCILLSPTALSVGVVLIFLGIAALNIEISPSY